MIPLREPQPVALDISDFVLRAVALDGQRRPSLTAFQELLLPSGYIVEGEIVKPREVAERIRTLLDHATPHRIRRTTALASLPDRRTFVKLVPLERPSHDAPDLEQTVRTLLPQHFPFSAEDVYLDWQAVTDREQRAYALIGAAPRTLVDRYVETLRLAGLTPVGFEMESLAIARAVLPVQPTVGTLVVDLGGTRTTCAVIAHGLFQFSSSLPISGYGFTSAVANALHVDREDAEKLKVLYGLTRSRVRGSIAKALHHAVTELQRALTELLRYYENHFTNPAPIEHVILTGGGAQLLGLPEMLAQLLERRVTIGVPAQHLRPAHRLPAERWPSFTTAIGVALAAL